MQFGGSMKGKNKKNKGKVGNDPRKIVIPLLKPRNPFVLPPNKRHEDRRKKEKHKKNYNQEG